MAHEIHPPSREALPPPLKLRRTAVAQSAKAGRVLMTAAMIQIFEYACHEGNHAMTNILSASRAEEGR